MNVRAERGARVAALLAFGAHLALGCSEARPAASDSASPPIEDEATPGDGDGDLDTAPAPIDTVGVGPGPLSACEEVGALVWLDLPEASGAARLDAAGDRVVIVADSGNRGRALILDGASGTAVATTLPVDDGVGDDVEGLARAPDGRIIGLTSAGWFREWRPEGEALAVVRAAYRGTDAAGYSCDGLRVNCGANYEGLCLDPAPVAGGCAGFAVAKARGQLVCVRAGADGYRIDPSVIIPVSDGNTAHPDMGPLSGCSVEPDEPYRLIVAGNAFTGSALWEVAGYRDPATAVVTELPYTGAPNQEAVLFVADHAFASFGDLQTLEPRSPQASFRCR